MLDMLIEDLGITRKRAGIGAALLAGSAVLVALGGSPVVYVLTGAACGYLFATLVQKPNR